ncbi:DUF454 domain-containing protein [Paracoccus suum]|uniref:DUF454 domain-containing protein n=1 Tax=Paracoccus suum TaxID=2259340 RepID=A0A344PHU5_9RHOB|nr:YbaN family protein [Paracoccus suum]AXC48950.1 DUF454 domain-containing protein [Paracoccus suum]
MAALALGVIGVVLPVMPTVPFLLVAVWCFSRSSPALRARILNHPAYGPPIRAWVERGAIRKTAKLWAVLAMASGVGIAIWLGMPVWLIGTQAAICLAVASFVVTRPSR